MDKFQLTGRNLGIFSTLEVTICRLCNFGLSEKLPDLKLKTRTKQLRGSLPLVIALPKRIMFAVAKAADLD